MKSVPIALSKLGCFFSILFVTLLIPVSSGAGSQPLLIKDINETAIGSSSYAYEMTAVGTIALGGLTFFSANDEVHGTELWRSDGTENGTSLVKDIIPGTGSSEPSSLTAVNGTLFFVVHNYSTEGDVNYQLWKSDGTEGGTVLVKEISIGYERPSFNNLIAVNGTLLFTVQYYSNGNWIDELWKTDGTESGTFRIKEFYPDADGHHIYYMTSVSNMLFFVVHHSLDGVWINELWKSDGTEGGTTQVKDITLGLEDAHISYLINLNGTLFFVLQYSIDGAQKYELWKSDGTEVGTVIVKEMSSSLGNLTNVNGTLFFVLYYSIDGVQKNELWKSNGTDAGTVLVKDFIPSSESKYFSHLAATNNTLFIFYRSDPIGETRDIEIWKSDGTEAGTVLVRDDLYCNVRCRTETSAVGDLLFFRAYDFTSGLELWKSDGTEAGTVPVKDIYPGTGNSFPYAFSEINGMLYFIAHEPIHGRELWKTDGTEAGTTLIKDIYLGSGGGQPHNFTDVNGTLFFIAQDGTHGYELWKIEESIEMWTSLVKDINPGSDSSYPNNLTNVNGTLFFSVQNDISSSHYDLWKSNGTESGTVRVKEIYPGSDSQHLYNMTSVNGMLFFTVGYSIDEVWKEELWKSDGTEAGTSQVNDIALDLENAYFSYLINVNDMLFFTVHYSLNGVGKNELWKSDGTEIGTELVKDIYPNSWVDIHSLITSNGKLYFIVNATYGYELWVSDGTEAGTLLIKNINHSSGSIDYDALIDVNGTLFFKVRTYSPDGNNYELWKSDGTEIGTVMVKEFGPFSDWIDIYEMTSANNSLFFIISKQSSSGSTTHELWKSDGSDAGTVLVKNMNASYISYLTNINGKLFFTGWDPINGNELWESDGTEAGTVLVYDIFPGAGDSYPSNLTPYKNNLVFNAKGWMTGNEPFILDMTNPSSNIGFFEWYPGHIQGGSRLLVGGTASDDWSGVADVEVSVDSGNTWISTSPPSCGDYCNHIEWSYDWLTPTTGGTFYLYSRAIDFANNVEIPTRSIVVNVLPVMHTLNVTVNGPGRVNSDPIDVNCVDNCTQEYVDGTDVILYSSYDTGVTFGGWAGNCSGTDDCTLTMDGPKSVTANYYQNINNPVILEGLPGSFTTIQQAYNSIASGQFVTMKVKAGDQASGDLMFNRDVTIKLEGGYDHAFINIIGDTSFSGTLTITDGTASISNLIIK